MRAIGWEEAEQAGTGAASVAVVYFFDGRNAPRTGRHFGISRQTFCRWKRRFDRHDLTTLEQHSHRPRRVCQPMSLAQTRQLDADHADAIVQVASEPPGFALDLQVAISCAGNSQR